MNPNGSMRQDRQVASIDSGGAGLPTVYGDLFDQVKAEVREARVRAARVVNVELIDLYWRIGRLLVIKRREQGWGGRIVERLSADLRAEFPGIRGFAPRSLEYMQTFASAWPEAIAQQPVARLPWGHITVLLDRLDDQQVREWYVAQDVQYGWSRAVLSHHIETGRHLRIGTAPNNFTDVLPAADSDQVREILQDPYNLDFLALDPGHTERDLEDALISGLTHFLTELGAGFAFVGRQYRLPVGDREFFIDLLFYHLGLRRFIVFELKSVGAEPEHIGKLNFYVNVVDDLLRRPEHGDAPTIGILLAASRDDVVVEYALRGLTTPVAVSTFTTHRALPDEIRAALPTPADLAAIVRSSQPPQGAAQTGSRETE